jgi:hypothetical protein
LKPRIIAYYLPQFYPIPENEAWWGKGFTDWTTVKNAKPLFPGHRQPHKPGVLGYYDLRNIAVRDEQAKLASRYGVEGFCYWHYWFGNGKRILNEVFDEVLISGKPDFPFCLGWANHTWYKNKFADSASREVLIEQTYPGIEDYSQHFELVLKAFKDKRYLTVDGKPIFVIYRPWEIPDLDRFIRLWNQWSIENGLKGIYFIAYCFQLREIDALIKKGFSAVNIIRLYHFENYISLNRKLMSWLNKHVFNKGLIIDYKEAAHYFDGREDEREEVIPTIIPNWDHSPRSGRKEHILINSEPIFFYQHVERIINRVKSKANPLVFVKSWNEWAEGNYLEPDEEFGLERLEALTSILNQHNDFNTEE